MASAKKQVQQTARQFFKLSLDGQGAIAADRVSGVLEYIEKHRPAHALAVLRAYQRLVAAEVARSRALVEHAGAINPGVLEQIAAAMSRRYGRAVTSASRRNDTLLAGLRVRIGDDVYESSVSGQLAALGAAV